MNKGNKLPQIRQQITKGIVIISNNGFFKRIWFWVTNPLRYIFTGKMRF